jgi:hypothetical protein
MNKYKIGTLLKTAQPEVEGIKCPDFRNGMRAMKYRRSVTHSPSFPNERGAKGRSYH